jgi:deazaflavin-dependent oxidoreductase (nitroreductase family)
MRQIRLTTMGRRSGTPRPVTLYAFPAGEGDDRLVVVGSSGGSARDPAWVANLRADAHAILSTASAPRAVVAREAAGSERDRLWSVVCEALPLYATYQRRTARLIPLFVLEPADGG